MSSTIKKNLFWATIEQLGPQVFSFFISIVLARLLLPSDYGLIGMVSIFLAYGRLFADAGMSQALIQKQNITHNDEKSVFLLNIGLGIVISILICAISPLVASFFQEPRLISIMCVISLNFIISSFSIVQFTLLSRNLQLDKIAFVSIFNALISGIISVFLAYKGFGVWSLVWGGIASNTINTIGLWYVSSWRPKGNFSKESLVSMWKFSSNIFGTGLFTTLVDNLSNILIGKSYSASDLGVYTKANQLQLLPVSLLTGIINRVSFPFFSRLQEKKEELLMQLRKSIRTSLFAISYVCILLTILADQLIPWLFGNNWTGSIPYMQILSISGIFYPINVLLITSIKSIGRSDLYLKVEIIKKSIIMVTLLMTCFISIKAMAISLIFTGAMAYFFNAKFTVSLLKYQWKYQLQDIVPIWILFSIVGTSTFFMTYNTIFYNSLMMMVIRSLLYTIFTIILLFIFRKNYFADIWIQITFFFNKIKLIANCK